MTLLERLAAAIEAGKVDQFRNLDSEFGKGNGIHAKRAYNGSLDAAKALHNATLGDGPIATPGYYAAVWLSGKASVWDVISNASHSAEIPGRQDHEASPARAWLLAIVRALIAKETKE